MYKHNKKRTTIIRPNVKTGEIDVVVINKDKSSNKKKA